MDLSSRFRMGARRKACRSTALGSCLVDRHGVIRGYYDALAAGCRHQVTCRREPSSCANSRSRSESRRVGSARITRARSLRRRRAADIPGIRPSASHRSIRFSSASGDKAHSERDLFQAGDFQALPMFDRRDVISRFEQAGLRAGVEPCHPAAQQLHVQFFLLEIEPD